MIGELITKRTSRYFLSFSTLVILLSLLPLSLIIFQNQIIMGVLKDRFKEKADEMTAEIKNLLKEHGSKVIGEVQLSQVYQGMRGITGLVSETSLLDAQDGIRFRGYSIAGG